MARNFDGVDDIIYSTYSTGITSYNWLVSVWFRTSVASGKKIVGAEDTRASSPGRLLPSPLLCRHGWSFAMGGI
jgi:hypothetical protein